MYFEIEAMRIAEEMGKTLRKKLHEDRHLEEMHLDWEEERRRQREMEEEQTHKMVWETIAELVESFQKNV